MAILVTTRAALADLASEPNLIAARQGNVYAPLVVQVSDDTVANAMWTQETFTGEWKREGVKRSGGVDNVILPITVVIP
jgi:hypothetical protein